MIIKYSYDSKEKQTITETEELANNYLSENFFKIKESLSRCGNIIYDVNSKKECEKILSEFFILSKKK